MELALTFIGAAAAAFGAYELLERLRPGRRMALRGPAAPDPELPQLPAWAALWAALWPDRFAPSRARGRERILDLLRRAGYPYPSLGAYYANAILTFGKAALAAAAFGAAWVLLGMDPLFFLPFAGAILLWALRAPEARLRRLIRRRAQAFRSNAMVGFAALGALLEAGVSPSEAMRRVGETVGGPFCNWLGFLAARMEAEDLEEALRRAEAHLPDPADVEMRLFLQALRDHFHHGQPLAPAVSDLREALRQAMVEETAARASALKVQAVAWGVLAIMGMMLTFFLPAAELIAGLRR